MQSVPFSRCNVNRLAVFLLGLNVSAAGWAADLPAFRPPAVPLVACDPYFSIWSPADKLTDADTVHWTGKPHRLGSLVRIDGAAYRVMGTQPLGVKALAQTGLRVLPTRTVYTFEGGGIDLTLTFLTPALPEEIELLARPVTYLTYEFRSTDGRPHEVALYLEAGAELTVNTPDQQVVWSEEPVGDLVALRVGSQDQPVLAKRGDDLRIDWGYLFLAAPRTSVAGRQIGAREILQAAFAG